jgi:hypothetical protein
MGLLDKIFGGAADGGAEERLAVLRQRFLKTASNQSFQRKLIKEQEANSIATGFDIQSKPHDPRAFVDVALFLLTYPPEIGYIICFEFRMFAPMLGFQPYGTIMVALGHIESYHRPMFVRFSVLQQKPELDLVLNSAEERITRAASLLTVGMVISAHDLRDTRKMFQDLSTDDSVRQAIVRELQRHDADLARRITS